MLWPWCILPSKNVHGSISAQPHGSISQAHFWGVEHLLASIPSRHQLEKEKKTTSNIRQQKNPKKKKSTSRMKIISNFVLALRIKQQNNTAPKHPKTNQHEENCYQLDGTSRITTESFAAESILCANLCWQPWLINEQASNKYSKSQPKAGTYLLKTGSKWKLYQIMCLPSKQCSKIKRLHTPLKQINMKRTATNWTGTSRITTENIAAESMRANLRWQPWLINEHVSKKCSKSQPKARTYLLKTGSKMTVIYNYVLALRTMQ